MSGGVTALETVQKPSTFNSDMHLAKRLLHYLTMQPRRLAFSLLWYPLNALCVVVPPWVLQQIFDKAIKQHDQKLLMWLCLAYLGSVVTEYATGFLSEYTLGQLGQEAMTQLRRDLFAHVQKLSTSFFDKNPIGRILTRLTNDVEALSEIFATGAISIIGDGLTVVMVFAMMLKLSYELTGYASLVALPMVVVGLVFQRYARTAFVSIRLHIARINTYLSEHISGMSVVQIFGQEKRVVREFEQLNAEYRDANRQAIFFDAALFSVVEAIGTAAVAAMIWSSAVDLADGAITAGVLVAFIQYIRRFFVPLRDLSTKYTVLQSAFAAAERTFALLDEPVQVQSAATSAPVGKLRDKIELKNVWFSYRPDPGPNDYVLRGIDLTVKRGERVALVGATGSGKSTILKLLNRFYDVQKGSLSIDGADVRSLDLQQLRRLFAVVLQDAYLFSGSLMENLAFADHITQAAVKQAMQTIGADRILSHLPEGYDTQVRELGANFSAGEKQLLALARALALDPDVLVLDEATSNVDSETESRIQTALDLLLKNRTAVVVAHRLSTIERMDRIVVLGRGAIIEQGDHATLMRLGGTYQKLVELHAAPSV